MAAAAAHHDPVIVPTGRRWTWADSLRVALALAIVTAGALIARDGVPDWERRLFEAINQAPDLLYPPLWPIMQLGTLGVGLVVTDPSPATIGAAVEAVLADRDRYAAAAAAGPSGQPELQVDSTQQASQATVPYMACKRPAG